MTISTKRLGALIWTLIYGGLFVIAWIWLDVATCAAAAAPGDAQRGRLAACRYFFRYELPRIGAWLGVVASRDDTCRALAEESF